MCENFFHWALTCTFLRLFHVLKLFFDVVLLCDKMSEHLTTVPLLLVFWHALCCLLVGLLPHVRSEGWARAQRKLNINK